MEKNLTNQRALKKEILSEKILITIFWVLCTIFFFLLTYYSLGSTYENAEIADEFPYYGQDSILKNVFLLLLMLIFIWTITKAVRWLFHNCSIKVTADIWAGIISIAAIVFSIYWVNASGTVPQSDQVGVCNCATAFNKGDFAELMPGGYAAVCRQQLGFITFLRLLFMIFGNDNYKACQYFSAVMAGCIVFFCYQVTKKLSKDNRTVEAIYLLLASFCAPLYFYVPFVYGDIPSTAFVALCAWMLLECLMSEKISPVKLIILGVSGGIAVQLRSNTLIFMIGFFIVIIIKLLTRRNKSALLSGVTLLAGILLFQGMIHFLYVDKISENSDSMPATLYIAMGTNDEGINPGWHNWYNMNTFRECNWDAEWANREALQTIGVFFDKCRGDYRYAIDFYKRKVCSQWNTPMYQCLAMNCCIIYEQYPLAKSIYFGRMRGYVEAFMNVYQLLIFGSVLFLLLWARKSWKQLEKYVLLIGIFGGFLFSMMWEAKARYVFPYFLMMLPYAALGIYCLYDSTVTICRRYVSLKGSGETVGKEKSR